MTDLTWTVQKAKVADLINWDKNPRKITEEAFSRLKERIVKRGFHDVIKTDGHNTILSGNQRKRALTELNIEEVNIMVPSRDLTDEEKDAVSIESNRNDGVWDWDKLANQFKADFLLDIGFEKHEVYFNVDEVSQNDVDLAKDVLMVMPPESVRLKERLMLHVEDIDEYNRIKKFLMEGGNYRVVVDELLKLC